MFGGFPKTTRVKSYCIPRVVTDQHIVQLLDQILWLKDTPIIEMNTMLLKMVNEILSNISLTNVYKFSSTQA